MIVTDAAKEELKRMLASAGTTEPDASFRLVAQGPQQLSLALDKEKEGDQVVEHEGQKLLLVDEPLQDALEGVTLDYQETPEGPRLTISTQ